jgi:hypothetical protein
MGNAELFIIILGCLIAVFAVLVIYAITLVVKLYGMTSEKQSAVEVVRQEVTNNYENTPPSNVHIQSFSDDDEEERLVVALAASAMAANDKPNSYFHISKITRIK